MHITRHAAIVFASSLFALAAGAQAQTLVVPADSDTVVTPEDSPNAVVVPGGADTILIVTPPQDQATEANPAPPTRDEVRAEAREAARAGVPRGEQNWADQTTHRQSRANPDLPSTHDNP